MGHLCVPTRRQFAAEQLERAGEVEMLRDRHLAWCNELAGALQDSLTIGGDQGALRRADAEESNMQAALAWAADRDAPAGEELAAAPSGLSLSPQAGRGLG